MLPPGPRVREQGAVFTGCTLLHTRWSVWQCYQAEQSMYGRGNHWCGVPVTSRILFHTYQFLLRVLLLFCWDYYFSLLVFIVIIIIIIIIIQLDYCLLAVFWTPPFCFLSLLLSLKYAHLLFCHSPYWAYGISLGIFIGFHGSYQPVCCVFDEHRTQTSKAQLWNH